MSTIEALQQRIQELEGLLEESQACFHRAVDHATEDCAELRGALRGALREALLALRASGAGVGPVGKTEKWNRLARLCDFPLSDGSILDCTHPPHFVWRSFRGADEAVLCLWCGSWLG